MLPAILSLGIQNVVNGILGFFILKFKPGIQEPAGFNPATFQYQFCFGTYYYSSYFQQPLRCG